SAIRREGVTRDRWRPSNREDPPSCSRQGRAAGGAEGGPRRSTAGRPGGGAAPGGTAEGAAPPGQKGATRRGGGARPRAEGGSRRPTRNAPAAANATTTTAATSGRAALRGVASRNDTAPSDVVPARGGLSGARGGSDIEDVIRARRSMRANVTSLPEGPSLTIA